LAPAREVAAAGLGRSRDGDARLLWREGDGRATIRASPCGKPGAQNRKDAVLGFAEAETVLRGYRTPAAKELTTTQITVQSPSDKSKIRPKYAPVSHSEMGLSAAEWLRRDRSYIGDSRRCALSNPKC
jgi:hypothetical protein